MASDHAGPSGRGNASSPGSASLARLPRQGKRQRAEDQNEEEKRARRFGKSSGCDGNSEEDGGTSSEDDDDDDDGDDSSEGEDGAESSSEDLDLDLDPEHIGQLTSAEDKPPSTSTRVVKGLNTSLLSMYAKSGNERSGGLGGSLSDDEGAGDRKGGPPAFASLDLVAAAAARAIAASKASASGSAAPSSTPPAPVAKGATPSARPPSAAGGVIRVSNQIQGSSLIGKQGLELAADRPAAATATAAAPFSVRAAGPSSLPTASPGPITLTPLAAALPVDPPPESTLAKGRTAEDKTGAERENRYVEWCDTMYIQGERHMIWDGVTCVT